MAMPDLSEGTVGFNLDVHNELSDEEALGYGKKDEL